VQRLTRFVALALLAWLPLQAAALPALVTACELDPAHSPMHQGAHEHHGADHDDASQGDDGAGGHDGHSGGSTGGHGCCHHYSTAAPGPAVAASDAGTTMFVTPPLRPSEFIPEQPKRPPLATL
jgi:hypothetical protein